MELNFTHRSFELLEGLEANNEKAWYTEHKNDFETYLRTPFAMVLEWATECLEDTDVPFRGSAKTMFRQHRDVRFSKDKSPYSTFVGGLLTPSGTKAEKEGVLYVQLNSSGGLLACGFYKFKAAELGQIRDRIVEEPDEFSQVLQDLEDAGLSLDEEDKLSSMPRGYQDYKDHIHGDYLKLKSFIVQTPLSRQAWLASEVVDRIVTLANGCVSLLEFGRDSAE
ncbi:tigr02453 family protein [Leptolyngbya sp. Heron Island J]|uniref:DUF2461 domain-containing protein n=1 Tax=Leptolyngbya sp. Heron Island J TaxID=1385935 RepID=UPI0003B94AF9|nr:DUF2461 domain-containing protein [Leptolyngbya sp. Heron Island J]ESA31966.1 tigr02453 family protein [Leptolyngbya sp. Heron Island J]